MGEGHRYLRQGMTVLLAFMLSCFAISSANSAPVDMAMNKIHLYGVNLIFPSPSWVDKNRHDVNSLSVSKMHRQQQGAVFVFQLIPKAQEFSNWRQVFSITAVYNGAKKAHLNAFIRNTLGAYYSACGKKNVTISTVNKEQHAITIQLVCQSTPHASKHSGYGPGVGEVALIHFIRTPTVLIKLYQGWRGAAFKFNDRRSWPVSPAILQETKRRLTLIRVSKGRSQD